MNCHPGDSGKIAAHNDAVVGGVGLDLPDDVVEAPLEHVGRQRGVELRLELVGQQVEVKNGGGRPRAVGVRLGVAAPNTDVCVLALEVVRVGTDCPPLPLPRPLRQAEILPLA